MNSLGDFPPSGATIPYTTLSFLANSNGYFLEKSSLDMDLKSTMGSYINGYPTLSPPPPPPPPSTMVPCSQSNSADELSNQCDNESFEQLPNETSFQEERMTISKEGFIKNLPRSMIQDQFGIAGLFVGREVIKQTSSNEGPSYTETMCSEVKTEMRHVNQQYPSDEPYYTRFSGPLELPSEPESFSTETGNGVSIYPEYLVTHRMLFESREPDMNYIRKTWALKIEKFGEDLLFYLFYTHTRDMLQIMAARNLYLKGWRFHTELKVWLRKIEYGAYSQETGHQEKGTYKYFDTNTWKVVQTELTLDISKLEGAPQMPTECFLPTTSKN